MSQINPKTKLKDYEGKPLENNGQPVYLKTIIINALSYEDDKLKANGDQKLRAYTLGVELSVANTVKLSSEDIVFIKERLVQYANPLVYGQTVALMEGDLKETKEG